MTPLKHFGIACLFVGSILAMEARTQSGDPQATAPPVVETRVDDVLALAPADALFVGYTADAKSLFAHSALSSLVAGKSDLESLVNTLTRTFSGPVMFGLSGVPANPLSWRVTFAARITLDRNELFRQLGEIIVPSWNRSEGAPGQVQFWDDGEFGYLQVIEPIPLLMTLAVREDIVLGSTEPGLSTLWRDSGEAGASFANTGEFRRLNQGRSAPIDTLLYLDVRPLLPLAAAPLNEMLPNLYDAWRLGDVEFVALADGGADEPKDEPAKKPTPETVERTGQQRMPKSRPPDRGDPLRLAVGLKQITPGPWHLVASAPSAPMLARVFPEDTTLFVHGSMERASTLANDIRAFAATIDTEITDEYEQELADFRNEVGFDPHAEFLHNFVREWAFGARIPPFDNKLLALQLENESTFRAHMHRLRLAFNLEVRPTTYRGVTIEHAARKLGPFAYAVVDGVLIISPDAGMIERAIDASKDSANLLHAKAFDAVRRHGAPRTSEFVFFDLASAFSEMAEAKEAAQFPEFLNFVKAETAAGLKVVPYERMVALELVTSAGRPTKVIDLLTMVITSSLERARYLSMQAICLAHVQGILTACHVYAADNKKQWPRSLEQLAAEGVLGDKETAARILANPYKPNQPPGDKPYYLYRSIPDKSKIKELWDEVVVSEPAIHDGGAVFGFMDGHSEWITSPRAEELLSIMRSGR